MCPWSVSPMRSVKIDDDELKNKFYTSAEGPDKSVKTLWIK